MGKGTKHCTIASNISLVREKEERTRFASISYTSHRLVLLIILVFETDRSR